MQPGKAGQFNGTGLRLGSAQQNTSGLQQPLTGGLNLGGGGGLQLGTQSTPGGLQLGSAASTTATPGGLQLGGFKATSTAGIQLGGAPTGGLQLGTSTSTSGLQLGKTTGGLQLGAPAAATTGGGLQLGMPATATTSGGLKLGGGLQSGGGLKLGGGLQTGTQLGGLSTGLKLGTSTAAGGGVQLGGVPSTGVGLQLGTSSGGLAGGGLKLAGTTTSSLGTGGTTLSLSGAGGAPSTGAPTAPVSKYSYKQLENLVNKWSLELADQEKVFLQQAKQVQMWDRSLASSAEKIAELNTEVQNVKSEQQKVDGELDLIKTQQAELEELLGAMEKLVDQMPMPLSSEGQHADHMRTQTFKMAEDIDSQLKRMAEDLKEIIEQINTANSNQDQDQSTFSQIVQILNAHTESLGWIDRETILLKQKVEDVKKIADSRKKEREHTFRSAFSDR